jgi:prefoldin alpha subunit
MAQNNQNAVLEAQAQLRYLQNVYSQQYELLENEIATFTLAMASTQRNVDMLGSKARLENSNILINGETGVYLEAHIKKVDKAVIYVGAGYLVEKSLADAEEYLKTNVKKQEETFRKLVNERQKIEKELVDISYKLAAIDQGRMS